MNVIEMRKLHRVIKHFVNINDQFAELEEAILELYNDGIREGMSNMLEPIYKGLNKLDAAILEAEEIYANSGRS